PSTRILAQPGPLYTAGGLFVQAARRKGVNSAAGRCTMDLAAQVSYIEGLRMKSELSETEILLGRAAGGDAEALAELFCRYRKRLRQMVRLRLDRRLHGRVDPSDVLQEAYLDLTRQLPAYLDKREMPFFLWLRLLTGQRLMRLHRQHLGAAMRDA